MDGFKGNRQTTTARIKENARKIVYWKPVAWSRPAQLLLTVVLTLGFGLFVDAITGWHVYHRLFYPKQSTPADVQAWSALIYALVLIGGLPVAFHVWYWRDRNVRDQIENSRKDVNLKEFQEVQLRAVGATGEDVPDDAKHVLQVAALHQLRGFLKGDFGPAFKRPAFETYCALLSRRNAADATENVIASPIFFALREIVYEDWKFIFWEDYENRLGWPLEGKSFRSIYLPANANLAGLNLSRMDLSDSTLTGVNFTGVQCVKVNFERCSLRFAVFDKANCRQSTFTNSSFYKVRANNSSMQSVEFRDCDVSHSEFVSADFSDAYGKNVNWRSTNLNGVLLCRSVFKDVNLQDASLDDADLSEALLVAQVVTDLSLERSKLSGSSLIGFDVAEMSSCQGAIIDSNTNFHDPQSHKQYHLLGRERDEYLTAWKARGAILADDQNGIKSDTSEDSFILKHRGDSEEIMRKAIREALTKDNPL